MPDQPVRVRVVCHNCPPEERGYVRAYVPGLEYLGRRRVPCSFCNKTGVVLATLADPEVAALPSGWTAVQLRGEWTAALTWNDPMPQIDNSVTWSPARGMASVELYTSGPPERVLAQVRDIPAVLNHLRALAARTEREGTNE